MQENSINSYSDQFMKQYQSVMQLNFLLLTSLEKEMDLQMKTINDYSHLIFEQAKNNTDFNNIDYLQHFADEYSRNTTSLTDRCLKGGGKLTELSQEFISDSENIWQIL